jgi:predicted site-specific integrase-resolvase
MAEYVTSKEIREHFGISRRTYSRWVKSHKLPAPIQCGRIHKYNAESIRKFEEALRIKSEKHMIRG